MAEPRFTLVRAERGKTGLWVVFDTRAGGPPSTNHLSTTNQILAEEAVRALNAMQEKIDALVGRHKA